MNAISPAIARQLCLEISAANRNKWYSAYGWWCRGCAKFSGEVSRRRFASRSDCRGCAQVNARYRQLTQIKHNAHQPSEF